jgi:hypothetical protein
VAVDVATGSAYGGLRGASYAIDATPFARLIEREQATAMDAQVAVN